MKSHEHPYRQFKCALHFGSGESLVPDGGSAIRELVSDGLRHASANEPHVTKITGINKSTDITLKRG